MDNSTLSKDLIKQMAKFQRPEDAPKGSFCQSMIRETGKTQSQASRIISNMLDLGAIEYIGHFYTRKRTGAKNFTPFYVFTKGKK